MQNVAQHWNECIQISEAERIEAAKEIARLEDEVHCAENALEMSKQVVAEKDAAIQELADLHKSRKEEGSLVEKESQRLLREVESLRSDLAKCREDKAAIHEKYRKHRAKLNEAVREQQALFTRARALYDETAELQKDQEKRAADVKAVELALEASRKKREELKSCIEKYRAETEQETQKSKTPFPLLNEHSD
jgi:chromosome segregation ATPase